MKSKALVTGLIAAAWSAVALASSQGASVIGINFCDGWENPHVSDGTADGLSTWTDSRAVNDWTDSANQGTPLILTGSTTVGVTWSSANTWAAGNEDNNEQALYRVYLDDGNLGDGIGVRVTLTGLSAWLTAEGQTSFQIRAYCSTDTDGATFHTITIHNGSLVTDPSLGTISPAVLGDNDYPTNPFDTNWTPRGYADSTTSLTADTITLTIPSRSGDVRGTLAALKITAIPESGTAILAALGCMGLFVRRRR